MDQINFHYDVVILLKFWNHRQVRRTEKRGKFKAVKTLIFTLFALSHHLTFDAFLKDFHCLIVNLVGFLYTGKNLFFYSHPKQENDLDALTTHLLDNSAAKHKISVRPKKNHSSSNLHKNVSPQSQSELNTNEKYVYPSLG